MAASIGAGITREWIMEANRTRVDERQKLDRRHLLRGLGVGAGAVAGIAAPAAAVRVAAAESRDERTKARYQPDAEDVQKYYQTNRY
jgi:hypothetical protein